ncbi:MAG TPA: signal peptide peptidase SppA [Syntrophales bacterium]|nr:signal peptide peptidase SppA [Syntrophales bacterium]
MKRLVVIGVLAALTLPLGGCAYVNLSLLSEPGPFREKVVDGEGDAKILVLDVTGIISEEKRRALGLRQESSMIDEFREALQKAGRDKRVAGLVVRINSPGGTVTASDILRHEILEYKKKTGVRVVACMMDVAASGGYYVATAADEIVAHPTTITGSIGVIAMKFNVQGLFGKIGVEAEAVKSGDKKDLLSPFRPATEEERRIVQAVIDQLHARFVDVIVEGRKPLSREAVVKLADGRIYTAAQALDLGLVDRVGYLDGAVEGLKGALGLKNASVVVYHRPGAYKGSVYAGAGGNTTVVNILPQDLESLLPRGMQFMYLWAP